MCKSGYCSKPERFYGYRCQIIMDALDQEYKHFDEDILPIDARELIEKRLVELHALCMAMYEMSTS